MNTKEIEKIQKMTEKEFEEYQFSKLVITIEYEEIVCENCKQKAKVQIGKGKDPLTGKRFCSQECYKKYDTERTEKEAFHQTLNVLFKKK